MPPLTRKQQKQQTRNLIYSSAIDMFLRKGYEQVSVDDIVAHCGISKGAFYHHFISKNALLLEYASELHMDMLGQIRSAFRDTTTESSYEARLHKLFATIIHHHVYNFKGLRLLADHAAHVNIKESAFFSFFEEIRKISEFILLSGQQASEFSKRFSPAKTAEYMTHLYYTEYLSCMEECKEEDGFQRLMEQNVQSMVQIFLQGIKEKARR
jgi:TetR/AcrR family transcriptional regulator, fatty acid metabolism regulator protein